VLLPVRYATKDVAQSLKVLRSSKGTTATSLLLDAGMKEAKKWRSCIVHCARYQVHAEQQPSSQPTSCTTTNAVLKIPDVPAGSWCPAQQLSPDVEACLRLSGSSEVPDAGPNLVSTSLCHLMRSDLTIQPCVVGFITNALPDSGGSIGLRLCDTVQQRTSAVSS
jgi:hypothetical protein